jgi:Zn-dependent protease
MIAGLTYQQLGIFLGSLLLAMSFHEAMHGFTAHWLGDTTAHEAGRLTLNPLKHIDLVTTILLPLIMLLMGVQPILAAKPVPFNPYRVKYAEFGAALIGLAGPLTNLLLAIAVSGMVRLTGVAVGTLSYEILSTFIAVNIALFVFNMIPFPPLDGSRLLYAVAPEPVQKVMARIEAMGFGVILLFIIVLFPVISPIIYNANSFLLHLLLG